MPILSYSDIILCTSYILKRALVLNVKLSCWFCRCSLCKLWLLYTIDEKSVWIVVNQYTGVQKGVVKMYRLGSSNFSFLQVKMKCMVFWTNLCSQEDNIYIYVLVFSGCVNWKLHLFASIWIQSWFWKSWDAVWMKTECSHMQKWVEITCSEIVFTIMCFTKRVTSSHSCLWPTELFEVAPLIPNHKTITGYQWTWLPEENSEQVFFEHSLTFPVFSCFCTNFFETCCWHQVQNRPVFTNKMMWMR